MARGHSRTRSVSTVVSENDNCCLWLRGFPADLTVHRFLYQIQLFQLGKVAAVYVHPPVDEITTTAVKATMWDRAGAERLFQAITAGQFGFYGYRLHAHWNRHAEAAQRPENDNASRVILVIGPTEIVNPRKMLP
ncbi:uncharacterized protein PG998_011481 [Apiospora kogelbergensis]|uniref:uncharacterized protein n=1 Tax=Apiospora kogelbergensis TaxID=1337665 RepID=UPI00313015F2